MDMDQIRKQVRGIALTTVTPLREDGAVDEQGIHRLVNYFLENGINNERGLLIPNSTTGNFGSLSLEEKKLVAKTFIEAADGRIPVAVGCNGVRAADVIELANYAQDQGAVAIMVGPPFYWKPTETQIEAFYKEVSRSVDIGVVIYNNHWASQVDIGPELLEAILQSPNVIGLKESTWSVPKLVQVGRQFAGRINLFNGMGEANEPTYAELGCVGFTSTLGNMLPGVAVEMHDLLAQKDYTHARELAARITPVATFLDNLTGGQYIPALLHILNHNNVCGTSIRLPLVPLSEDEINQLETLVDDLGS